MHDNALRDLEAQLEEAHAARVEAEQNGAELAKHAIQAKDEAEYLRSMLSARGRDEFSSDARRTLSLERWIAYLLGLVIYRLTCDIDSMGFFIRFPSFKLSTYLMCGAPLVFLYFRNSWRRFRFKHGWNSWRDNDFVNELRQVWTEKTSSR